MNFYWVYDPPNWLVATLTVTVFVLFSTIGLWISQRLARRSFGRHAQNEIVSFHLSTAGVFYGITLEMIAVGSCTTYSNTDDAVSKEAASVAVLYREFSSYPEPAKSRFCGEIESYTHFVINEERPKQKRGIVLDQGAKFMTQLYGMLADFNPSTEREKIIHVETLDQFSQLMEQRRMRLKSVNDGLPLTMYMVIIIGAVLNIVVSWLLVVELFKLHMTLNALMAALLGLLVYLVAALDNPFRGEFSIGPDEFVLLQNQLMPAKNLQDAPPNIRH